MIGKLSTALRTERIATVRYAALAFDFPLSSIVRSRCRISTDAAYRCTRPFLTHGGSPSANSVITSPALTSSIMLRRLLPKTAKQQLTKIVCIKFRDARKFCTVPVRRYLIESSATGFYPRLALCKTAELIIKFENRLSDWA